MENIQLDTDRARIDPPYFLKKLTNLKPHNGQKTTLLALEEYKKIIVKAGRRWGKTIVNEGAGTWFPYTHPGTRTGYFAPEWDQCEVFMEGIYDIIRDSVLNYSLVEDKKLSFKLSNGSSLITKTANISSQSGRGRGFDLGIVDESAFIPDVTMAAIRPTFLVGMGYEIHSSNPAGHNHFYKDYNGGIFHPISFKSIDNPMVNKKDILAEKKILPSFQFRQEYEAEFIEDEFNVFPIKLIEKAQIRGVQRNLKWLTEGIEGKEYYGGIDYGRTQDKTVIGVLEHDHPKINLVYLKEIKKDIAPEKFWTTVTQESVDVALAFKIKKFCCDQTSIGDAPTLDLKRTLAEKNIPSIVEGIQFSNQTKNSRDGIVNGLITQFERPHLAFPHDPALISQLQNVRRSITARPTKDIISTFSLTGLDRVTALALAVKAVPLFSQGIFYVRTNELQGHNYERGVTKIY